ncbi:RNase H-like domain found in reverse transcriptase [Popillia japonica]|uniref:RNase H-like domain found in reverse transcriptase n=1 Tax=Popillia japonica TaxID=7064 RepID=A0AAW1IRC7_POPJA
MRLESAFEIFAVPEDKRFAYLLHYMGSEAYDIVCDKISPEKPSEKSYEELISVIKSHYSPEPLEIAEIFRFLQRKQHEGESALEYLTALQRLATTCKFLQRKQHEGESALEYLTALQRLATTCKFGDYLKKALRNQFVFGLRAQNIQSRLLEQRNLTLERATEIAVGMETSARDAAQLHSGNASGNVNSVSLKMSNKKQHSPQNVGTSKVNVNSKNLKCFRCGSPKHLANSFRCGSPKHLANKCDKQNLTCHKCKRKGHLSKVCIKSTGKVEQIEEICIIQAEHLQYRQKFTLSLKVENVKLHFEIDSGAAVTLLSFADFKRYFPKLQLRDTDIKLSTYCRNTLNVMGFTTVTVEYKNIVKELNMYIIDIDKPPLLGREWLRQLQINLNNVLSVEQINSRLDNLLDKYSALFSKDMGKIKGLQANLKLKKDKGLQANLKLKKDVQPFYIKARKVPHALLPKVDAELLRLETEGVLEKVNSSEYATPIVPVLKANGNVRICGDFKCTLNPNLVIDEYPLPTIDALFSSLAGGDKFTKLDLQQAYLQMEVRPEDRKYLTLSTPKGLYRSTRLMYGIASAPAIWQREFENILKDIPGVSVFLDDIKITGPDDNTHFERLELVFERLQKYNIRVNYEKCQFFTNQIEYCGYIIDKHGIHKTKAKMEAICNARTPSNKTEVRAFVGLVNYYSRFLDNPSTTLRPIYKLLKDNVQFKWDSQCQKAFKKIKDEIRSDRVLAHFDPTLPLVLATDASPCKEILLLSFW